MKEERVWLRETTPGIEDAVHDAKNFKAGSRKCSQVARKLVNVA